MLEPAAYGAAVSFGPNTRNFRDIVAALLAADAAVVVHDAAELEAFVRRCLEDPAYAATLGDRAQQLVRSRSSAQRAARSHCSTTARPSKHVRRASDRSSLSRLSDRLSIDVAALAVSAITCS